MFLLLFSALLGAVVQGHMILNSPVPYGVHNGIDNSPLSSDGSNYPCKVTSDPATWYSQANIDNTYAAGSTQELSFKGSAVHGGGSCQLAITNDMQPSKDTSWRVVLSIESGCPTTDGQSPSTYNWTVPADLEPGKYSFAWTWISKEAGQPEYYMNCAPLTITAGSSSKRSQPGPAGRADSSSGYPELFVANLNSINSCKIGPGVDPVYPNPGSNVETALKGASADLQSVTIGSNCVPVSQTQSNGALPTPTAGGSGAGSTTGAAASASASPSGGVFITSTVKATASSSATTTSGADSSTLSVYVSPVTPGQSKTTGSAAQSTSSSASSAQTTSSADQSTSSSSESSAQTTAMTSAAGTTTATASSDSSVQTATATSSATETTSSASSSSSSSSAAKPTATGSGSSNSTSSGGGASKKSGTCTNEGTFNCVGSQYQQCASGAWTSMQALPAGTTCQQGESNSLWARDIRNARDMFRKIRRGVRTSGD